VFVRRAVSGGLAVRIVRAAAGAALFALGLTLAAVGALAHDFKIGDLKVDHPWARATPNGAKVGGGFLKVTNNGTTADRLVGGSLEGAKALEVHEMKMEGDVMKMRRLDKGLEIAPGQTVELKPGSYHVMFMDLAAPLQEGTKVKGTLVFEKAGKVDVVFNVEGLGAQPKGSAHAH